MVKHLLISGASGLLGINLSLEALQDYKVYGTAHDRVVDVDNLSFVKTDLLEPDSLQRLFDWAEPDCFIHCAALTNVDLCEEQPELAHNLNGELPGLIAQETHRLGINFIHISTDAVFDGLRGGYIETDIPNPQNVYARTKLEAESAVAAANPDAIVARVNFYGWSMSGDRSLAEFFFNNLQAGKQVTGFEDVFFCPLLANDLAKFLLEMLERGLHGLYHVVGSQALSKYEFGVRLARQFHLDENLITPVSVHSAGLSAPRSPNLTLRTEKLAQDLGRDIPGVSTGLHRLSTLYQQGYPQQLRNLLVAD
jgi:dTDP-4-dehydrorhamnose reductase